MRVGADTWKCGHDICAYTQAGSDPAFQVDEKSTYAEFWYGASHCCELLLRIGMLRLMLMWLRSVNRMGTHPNGPSRVVRDGKPAELLSEWLKVSTSCYCDCWWYAPQIH